jgi:3-oxoacyl-[acyl-carrier protein] reductase
MTDTRPLAGQVALVTGGSRGIGAAIARALADDGADVAISYSASANKAKAVVDDLLTKGVHAHAFKADQANAKEVEALVKSVVERFGHLNILVNNAGVFAGGQVHDRANNLPELDHLFAVNVGGVVAAVRAAAPLMGNGGRIISIGSVAGDTSPGVADLQLRLILVAGPVTSAREASPSTTSSPARSAPTWPRPKAMSPTC